MKVCAVHGRTGVCVAVPQLNCADSFGIRPIWPTHSSLNAYIFQTESRHMQGLSGCAYSG
jgi:hypothetical protein